MPCSSAAAVSLCSTANANHKQGASFNMRRAGQGLLLALGTSLPFAAGGLQDQLLESIPAGLAVGETFILLHPPLPLVGVSIETLRECQQNDSLTDG